MKDETKNKIKNGMKYTAISVGVILLFFLGVGIGSCSEKAQSQKAVEASAVDTPYNYLDNDIGVVYRGYNVVAPASIGVQRNPPYSFTAFDFDAGGLPAGRYVCVFNKAVEGFTWGGCLENLVYRVSHDITGPFDASNLLWCQIVGGYSKDWFTVDTSVNSIYENMQFLCIRTWDNAYPVALYAENDYWQYVASVSYSVDFPKNNWFPYQLLGQNQSPVIFGPAQSAPNSSRSIDIDGVYFRSAGRLWSGLTIQYSSLSGNGDAMRQGVPGVYGVLDEYGEWVWNKQVGTSTYLWYVASVKYKPFGGGLAVPVGAQRLKQYNDYSQAVSQIFDWVSDLYRHIEIVYDSGALITSVGGTPLTASEWLITLAENVFDGSKTPNGELYDVFDMFAGAFDSFASVMNIQILPYMTIGMLMFIPLIVIIVLAIVRLLNK